MVPLSNIASSGFQDATTLGNNLADYVDGGGVVVQHGFTFYGPFPQAINGRWVTGNYNPYNYSTNFLDFGFTLGTFNAGHPLMAGVTTLHAGFAENLTLAAGSDRGGADQRRHLARGVPVGQRRAHHCGCHRLPRGNLVRERRLGQGDSERRQVADWRPLPIAHADSDSDSHSYIHADTDCNGDRHSYGYIHAYTNSNSYSHPHCNANCNSHGNSHPDTNTHGDIYPNANSHSYIYSNANGDSNRNTYGDCYGHSYGYRDAYGNPDINANTNGNSNGYTDANVNCHARRLCSRTRVLEESSRSVAGNPIAAWEAQLQKTAVAIDSASASPREWTSLGGASGDCCKTEHC